MESTKRFAITFVATVTLLVLPALAQNHPVANTGVELREVVVAQGERGFQEADFVEQRYDTEQGQPSQVVDNTGLEDDNAAADVIADSGAAHEEIPVATEEIEESIIPRNGGEDASGEIARAGQAIVPWYRSPFVALLVVLGVIGAVATMVKRWVPATRTVTSEQLKVVGRTAISSKQSAVLLHVGKRVVLLGVTPECVNTLSEITDESEVAQLIGQAKTGEAKAQGFDATAIDSEIPVSSGFDSALAREIEQYEDAEVTASHPEVEDAVAIAEPEKIESPVLENASATTAVETKTNGQPPKHLNDLLARLRSFQKS